MSKQLAHYTVASEDDTRKIAQEIAKLLEPGSFVALNGELGAGKTTLVNYIIAALGSHDKVSSPTFVLQHIYKVNQELKIEHWDLYRLGAVPLELLESRSKDTIVFIEWADKFPELQSEITLTIRISHGEKADARLIELVTS